MKVIFLDVDGVLVNRRSLMDRSGRDSVADSKCVYALNHITDTTGAKIVVSSSWRFCGEQEMRLVLAHWKVRAEMISITPDLTRKENNLYVATPRGYEIQKWIDEHPEVTAFAILDDECDMAHLESKLVKTVFEAGLTEQDALKAIQMLTEPVQE